MVVRALNLLPGPAGLWMAHILLVFLGWYVIYLVERGRCRATWRSAPLGSGLVTLVVGALVLEEWAWLAGDAPHLEDGLAIFVFVLALRALAGRRELAAALLVGLAVAWKPWAMAALPLLWGCSRKVRALLIAVAIPAACWLPFLLGDPHTLSAVGSGLALAQNSPLRVLGFSGPLVPDWWRSVELSAALLGAALAARRDWRVAFAAGCTVRLMLDPAAFRYYYAGLILITFLTERIVGSEPSRTLALLVSAVYVAYSSAVDAGIIVQFIGLAGVFLSWWQPWRRLVQPAGRGAGAARNALSRPAFRPCRRL